MAVPKKKVSPSRKGMRQARHKRAEIGAYGENPDTGTLARRHHLSREADGSMWYKGRQVKAARLKPASEEAAPQAAAE
jgi:large subunit ribosomal protein L32